MMEVELVTSVYRLNDAVAEDNRELFREKGVFVLNMMSSPGSGKTTLLERTIEALHEEFNIGVIEGDLATARDAERIKQRGVPVVQINTGGGCHLDARMIAAVLPEFDLAHLDLLIIENIGNLVCPAGFDLGEAAGVTVLSVAEGNDKPLKYPVIFQKSSAVVVNKIDLLPYTDVDLAALLADLRAINPLAVLFPLSARTGEGLDPWLNWLKDAAAGAGKGAS